jgi:hypothetical protein
MDNPSKVEDRILVFFLFGSQLLEKLIKGNVTSSSVNWMPPITTAGTVSTSIAPIKVDPKIFRDNVSESGIICFDPNMIRKILTVGKLTTAVVLVELKPH